MQIRLTEDLIRMVDRLLERGIYSSRSEAVRKLVVESKIGGLAEKRTEKTSVELVKEFRGKIWRECLKEAGGDRKRALEILERKMETSE
ncbi:MAG: ribbon-helix-helix domain-containing protein [Nitrososphaerales archaeon]